MTDAMVTALRIKSVGFLAPQMRVQTLNVIDRMTAEGHDPLLIETLRLPQLQAEYFKRGTSRQRDVLRSMHGHGLAGDIVCATKYWNATVEFWASLERACKAEGLTWGGHWKKPVDKPHFQWGEYAGPVPDALVAAYNRGGLHASWQEAGAL